MLIIHVICFMCMKKLVSMQKRYNVPQNIDCFVINFIRPSLVEERVNIVLGSFYIPKDNKSNPKGDDAHFICGQKQTIGIADGVGGWTRQGVNAGEYARELMLNSVIALGAEPNGAVIPSRVLSEAYSKTKLPGSSTACLLSLNGNVCIVYKKLLKMLSRSFRKYCEVVI